MLQPPSRKWKVQDLDGEYIVTEEKILITYYPYWVGRMLKVGKLLMATTENCIDDWCVVNWAWEVKDEPTQSD